MPVLPTGVLKETEIAAAVAEVERLLVPDVIHIRFNIGQDWKDDWAVFFRVLLSDDAVSTKVKMREILAKTDQALDNRIDYDGLGLFHYRNIRTVSEQARIKEKAWA